MTELNRYQKRQAQGKRLRELKKFYETHATKSELAEVYGVSRYTVEAWQKKYPETYPKPIRGMSFDKPQGKGSELYFNKAEVDAWIWRRQLDANSTNLKAKAVNNY